jgi:hypothetical protein
VRAEVTEVIERLWASRRPEFRRLISDARLDDAALPAPSGDAVEPYRWLLERIGEGLALTSAGYLPPTVVAEIMQRFGWDAEWIGKGNREDLTRPVRQLRESARQLGLVRVYRGRLRCTEAGRRLRDDPIGLWRQVAGRLPLGRSEPEQHAGVLWLLAVAAGDRSAEKMVANGMHALGWVDGGTGAPMDRYGAIEVTRDTRAVFDCMGLLGRRILADDVVGPVAVELARTALLSEVPSLPSRRPAAPVPALELEVTLRDVEPRIWRRIVVPESMTLRHLHDVLQIAMGWDDSHLYLFAIGDDDYGEVEDMDELGDVHRTRLGTLVEPGAVFRYDYDFGDGWEHDVRVVRRTTADRPHCLDGARACPPEDCGGPHGYARLMDVLADPARPEHAELTDWLDRPVDAEAFDLDAVDAALRAARRGR